MTSVCDREGEKLRKKEWEFEVEKVRVHGRLDIARGWVFEVDRASLQKSMVPWDGPTQSP